MYYRELTGDQRRIYVDTVQVYEAYQEARDEASEYPGTMHWKTVRGRDYLYHRLTRRAKALGPRNRATEPRYRKFTEGKAAADARVATLKQQLRTQGALARAVHIDRVPPIAAKVLQAISDEPELKEQVMVVGTHALWAYEALAGVQFETDVMATKDVDIMWDVGLRIQLAGPLARKGLVGFLRDFDKTFRRDGRTTFRAVNDDGYAVDLLAPDRPGARKLRLGGSKDDLVAHRIDALNELLDAPPITQVIIGHLGHVVTEMRAPDPRAFVRHKLGLSKRTDRQGKQRRDLMMAQAVATLTIEHLPQFPMSEKDLEGFPEAARRELEAFA